MGEFSWSLCCDCSRHFFVCLERSSLLLYDFLQLMQLKVMPMCWFVLCLLRLLYLVKALLQIPQMNLNLSILRNFVFSIIQMNSVCMDNYRLYT